MPSRRSLRVAGPVVGLLVLGVVGAGVCGYGAAHRVPAAGLSFSSAPAGRTTTAGKLSLQVLRAPVPALPIAIPDAEDARLQLGFGVDQVLWALGPKEIDFVVTFQSGSERVELLRRRLNRDRDGTLQEVEIPLGALAGRSGELRLETEGWEAEPLKGNLILWTPPVLHPALEDERPNIVLFSIDTLRPDRLGCYGHERDTSPTLDRLAREGVLFRQAIATASWTLPSHASMLTGLRPIHHGATPFSIGSRIASTVETLAELLWQSGYATAGFTEGGLVSAMFGFDRGFDIYVSSGTSKNLFEENIAKAGTWIRSRGGQPFFLFLHTYAVHLPYAPPPPYNRMFDPTYEGPCQDEVKSGSIRACLQSDRGQLRVLEHVKSLYDGDIRSMDAIFNRFVAMLRSSGLAERTCIIITSDHGEEFSEHGHFFHGHAALYEELIHVPLIVWCPQRFSGGRSVDDAVSLVDIAPTILELAGVPIPPAIDGASLMPTLLGRASPGRAAVFSEVDESIEKREGVTASVRDGRYKLIASSSQDAAQLFDLRNDPGETHDLSASLPDVVSHLHAALATSSSLSPEVAEKAAEQTKGPPATPDPAVLERLRALGYIE